MTQSDGQMQNGHLSANHGTFVRVRLLGLACLLLFLGVRVVGAEIIPQDRRIVWAPGVPGGIPHYQNSVNVRAAPFNAVGDGIADDTAAIQSAVNSCPDGRAVLLPAGTYRLTATITISTRTVLRGEGPEMTRIIQDGTPGYVIRMGRWTSIGSRISLQADALKGATQLNLVSTAAGSGDYLVLSQLNKPGLVTDTGYGSTCTWCGNDVSSRSMTQVVPIASITGNVVNLSRPLYFSFTTGLSADAQRISLLEGAGIEDLYIEQRNAQSGGSIIYIASASRCWVKNVESYNTGGGAHVLISTSFGCEIRDSFLHEAHSYGSARGYGVFVLGWNSDHLIENNIIRKTRHSMVFTGGGSGVVFGYNYCMDVYTEPDTTFLSEDASTHGAHPFMNLFEGNVFAKLSFDNTWGSGSHNTAFRNHITAQSPGTVYGVTAVDVQENNYYINVVGNVLGTSGLSFLPWRVGYSTPAGGSSGDDPQVAATLLRHGNQDNSTGQIQWDPGIADHSLPNSYYLSVRPDFFGGLTWPAIGPDIGVGVIPAQQRYEAGPPVIDPSPPRRLRIEN